jgi:hypothetical protein
LIDLLVGIDSHRREKTVELAKSGGQSLVFELREPRQLTRVRKVGVGDFRGILWEQGEHRWRQRIGLRAGNWEQEKNCGGKRDGFRELSEMAISRHGDSLQVRWRNVFLPTAWLRILREPS